MIKEILIDSMITGQETIVYQSAYSKTDFYFSETAGSTPLRVTLKDIVIESVFDPYSGHGFRFMAVFEAGQVEVPPCQ